MESLYRLFRAIEIADVAEVTRICASGVPLNEKFIILDNPQLGKISRYYNKRNCLEIFHNTLWRRKKNLIGLNTMVEIFNILHEYGINWEYATVMLYITTDGYYITRKSFIESLWKHGEIEFIIRILPLAKSMNPHWNLFYGTVKYTNDYFINFILFIDKSIAPNYISVLTPEIRAIIILAYVELGIKYYNWGEVSVGDIRRLAMLINCGEINWKGSLWRESLTAEKDLISMKIKLMRAASIVWYLLFSAGLYENEKISELTESKFRANILKDNNRWFLRQELQPIVYLPIPLEARIQLWSVGKTMIFDRRQHISILLRS
jgi:hypothetical protein